MKSPQHEPKPLQIGNAPTEARELLTINLESLRELASMQDASTGKLPSAGLAAKAIYTLQFADERSITTASNLQDHSLQNLAKSLDAICRHEYTERRKIRVVGLDYRFLAEFDLEPEHMETEVEYHFVPGSMLSKQKEAVKNEVTQLLSMGMIELQTARKVLSSAVPDAFRTTYNVQEAAAKRMLDRVRKGEVDKWEPLPWHDAGVWLGVLTEYLLSARAEFAPDGIIEATSQAWEHYQQQLVPPAPEEPGAATASAAEGSPVDAPPVPDALVGAQKMEELVRGTEPPGFDPNTAAGLDFAAANT